MPCRAPHGGGHLDGVTFQQAGVTVLIGDDPDIGRDLGVALDEAADGRGEAGREATRGKHGNGFDRHALPLSGLLASVHTAV